MWRFLLLLCFSSLFVTRSFAQFEQWKFTRIDASDGLSDNSVQHILQLPDGRLAVTTAGNINLYDGSQFKYIHGNDSCVRRLEDYNGAYHVYADYEERLWVKDWYRVRCFDLVHLKYISDIDSLIASKGVEASKVTDLFVDSESEIWYITSDSIIRCGERQTRISWPKNVGHLQDVDVHDGRAYLFFSDSYLICYSLSDGRELYRKQAIADGNELFKNTSLVIKANGVFYQLRTGDQSVCLSFDPVSREWRELLRVPYTLHTLISFSKNDILITSSEHLWHIDASSAVSKPVLSINVNGKKKDTSCFNTIFKDLQGGIWIGTYDGGLFYAHESQFRFKSARFLSELGLSSDSVDVVSRFSQTSEEGSFNCRLTDSQGYEWAGTSDGLLMRRSKADVWQAIHSEDGLTNNYIHSLAEDRKGNVWVGTSYGINCVKTDAENVSIKSYTETDGTLVGPYRTGKAMLMPSGQMLFQGRDGYTMFHPDSLQLATPLKRPMLIGVSVNGERLKHGSRLMQKSEAYTNEFVFSHNENSISFDISALNFVHPHHTLFRYRIFKPGKEEQNEWTVKKANETGGMVDSKGALHLTLLRILPGSYTLQVQSSIGDSSSDILELRFRVNPPCWQTPLARILFVVLILLVITASFISYTRISRARMRRRHKEEILLMRIHNLIERCKEYEESVKCRVPSENMEYDCKENLAVKDISENAEQDNGDNATDRCISEEDSEFIRQAIELVEKNIDTRGYTVEQLSRDLCMERTGLYKKMTTLLDKSPSLFIRGIRLQHAASLLKEGKLSVAEIAERTGFSSSSHLSRCFQEEWGCTPKGFKELRS